MRYFWNPIVSQFRTQPIILIFSLCGIAVSLAFIMLFFMMNHIYEENLSPESHRERMLHVLRITSRSTGTDGGYSTGNMGVSLVRECFYPLEEAEAVTAYTDAKKVQVNLPGKEGHSFELKTTDDSFWKVFDFTFVHGKPFTKADLESSLHTVVIDENVARSLWGTTDVIGKSLQINYTPHKVAGVVRPVSSHALWAYSNLWVPYTTIRLNEYRPKYVNGALRVTILAPDKKAMPRIVEETNKRLDRFNQEELAAEEWEVSLLGQPDTQEAALIRMLGKEPELPAKYKRETLILVLLLVIPAVNLSALLNSRLRHRKMEIAVARSFGATRSRIVRELFMECFVWCLAGSILGLFMSIWIGYMGSHWLFPWGEEIDFKTLFEVLFRWKTFVWMIGACTVLNLISSGIPIWTTVRGSIAQSLKEEQG